MSIMFDQNGCNKVGKQNVPLWCSLMTKSVGVNSQEAKCDAAKKAIDDDKK